MTKKKRYWDFNPLNSAGLSIPLLMLYSAITEMKLEEKRP